MGKERAVHVYRIVTFILRKMETYCNCNYCVYADMHWFRNLR